MATWDDVARICTSLPETVEIRTRQGLRQWRVSNKSFLWERPLRRADLAELGDAAPAGPVLGASVPDEGAKQALIADEPGRYFTTAHFAGYPAVLARLDALDEQSLAELATEAWASRAPRRLVTAHLGS